jgi:hypothetical protein
MNPATEAFFGLALHVVWQESGLRRRRSKVVVDEVVMERFRLLERIGSGGMGTVYRAFDERLQREVALKEVHAAEPERVLREAQAAARLNHPGIVTLYELGERGGRALLVSELVPGETLAQMRSSGALCDRDVGEVAADLADALAHAHARGVVHRDLKPQNVIVSEQEGIPHRAKLMDFGIARVAGAPTLTEAGQVVGTLAYMSPEQAEGGVAGPESDVYSLALTLYECWAGENPVAAANPAATARRIGAGVPPLREYRPDLPEGLGDVLDACLDPDPELRPAAAELLECVEAELEGLDPENPVPLPDGVAPPRDRERARRMPRMIGMVAFAALLALLAGPVGAAGLALVLAALCLPVVVVGAPPAAFAAPLSVPLAAVGLGPAATALGAAGPGAVSRAVLGLTSWAWLLTASVALGAGPNLGIADQAPSGWYADPAIAAEAVLAPLVDPESLLIAAVFAVAAVVLGWILGARHAAIALFGAMLWAAGVDAALDAVTDDGLAASPGPLVLAAAIAVALEFALGRDESSRPRFAPAHGGDAELPGGRLPGRVAA